MRYLCAAVVGLLTIGFSSATPSQDSVKALKEKGCSSVQAYVILNNKPEPKVKEVKDWLDYFHTDLGGNIDNSLACDDAIQVFNGTYFNGRHTDLAKFKQWVAYIFKTTTGDETWHPHYKSTHEAANQIAKSLLSKPHPRLQDVEPLGSAGCSFRSAYQILQIAPRPLREEINMWLEYFSSDTGGHFSRKKACSMAYKVLSGSNFDEAHKDLALFKLWVEYFYSEMGGDAKTYQSANLRAVTVLSSQPPVRTSKLDQNGVSITKFSHIHLAVLQKWVTYLTSQDGGNLHSYEAANQEALKDLREPHPCLEDLKPWVKFFVSPQGGGLHPAAALTQADETLREKHPGLEDLKKTAEHFFAPEGGDHSHASSLEKAWKSNIPKIEPVLSDAKFCDGEGYSNEKGKSSVVWSILAFIFTGCGCVCIGVALFYKCSSQEGLQARLLVIANPLQALPFVNATPPAADVEMNIPAERNKHSFIGSGGCVACGSVKI